MTSTLTQNFSRFTQERLKPAIENAMRRKRRSLLISLGVALGLFVLLALGAYAFLAPYIQMMQTNNVTYWPLVIFAPLSLAMIVFCLMYILFLRGAVKEFRDVLTAGMAEFIDPGVIHVPSPKSSGVVSGVLLDTVNGTPLTGSDEFKGVMDGVAFRFADIRFKGKAGADGGKGGARGGISFRATFGRDFRLPVLAAPDECTVSLSGIESKLAADGKNTGEGLVRLEDAGRGRQILVKAGNEDYAKNLLQPVPASVPGGKQNGQVWLDVRDNTLQMIVAEPSEKPEPSALFDEFDLPQCREFCRSARFCLDVTRILAARPDIWQDKTLPEAQ